MRDGIVARSYGETLFELAQRHEGVEAFVQGMELVAELLEKEPAFRLFLETPRISAEEKKAMVRKVFGGALPRQLVNFLLVAIDKRRQHLLAGIARHFRVLVDAFQGRAYVEVTVARPVDDETRALIGRRLSTFLRVEAIPQVRVEPTILGGIVVRTGDTIYDGSLRRRLDGMRRRLIEAELPAGNPA